MFAVNRHLNKPLYAKSEEHLLTSNMMPNLNNLELPSKVLRYIYSRAN